MTNEKPTSQQIESHQFDLESVDREFNQALHDALDQVKSGNATAQYMYRDDVEDIEHLEHITIADKSGTIIYDQDFELENQVLQQPDPEDN